MRGGALPAGRPSEELTLSAAAPSAASSPAMASAASSPAARTCALAGWLLVGGLRSPSPRHRATGMRDGEGGDAGGRSEDETRPALAAARLASATAPCSRRHSVQHSRQPRRARRVWRGIFGYARRSGWRDHHPLLLLLPALQRSRGREVVRRRCRRHLVVVAFCSRGRGRGCGAGAQRSQGGGTGGKLGMCLSCAVEPLAKHVG